MLSFLRRPKPKNKQELLELLEGARDRGVIGEHLFSLMRSLLSAEETTLEDIMIPRVDMVAVKEDMRMDEVLAVYKKHGHTKMPVLSSEGEVVGILYIKQLVKNLEELPKLRVREVAVKPSFLPATMSVLDALREFQSRRISIAMVVDEYGSVVGMLTTEDLLEEIVGSITEEYDREEFTYTRLDDGSWLFNPRMPLEEASEVLGVELRSEEVSTLGGLLLETAGRVPQRGEKFKLNGIEVEVLEAEPKRIKLLKVRKVAEG